jgi:hypothetical protein
MKKKKKIKIKKQEKEKNYRCWRFFTNRCLYFCKKGQKKYKNILYSKGCNSKSERLTRRFRRNESYGLNKRFFEDSDLSRKAHVRVADENKLVHGKSAEVSNNKLLSR